MQITLIRQPIEDSPRTFGKLYVNGEFVCDTIEDQDRGLYSSDTLDYISKVKIKHQTAIPYGTYQVVMSFSNRFNKYLPELLDVPGYGGIRIHPGNTEADSSGCILPGIKNGDKVVNSRTTYSKLQALINMYLKKEKIFITISKDNVNEIKQS